jgi:outer membrane immunogenic protein
MVREFCSTASRKGPAAIVAGALVVAGHLALASTAEAQGRPNKWQGVHVGVHAGGAIGRAAPVNTSGVLGGAQLGVSGQFDRVVAGLEADVGTTTASHTGFGTKFSQGVNGSMRGRLGYSFDRLMVYGTAGGAVSNFSFSGAAGRASRTRTGTVVGFGADLMLTDNISARAEYLRYNYGRASFSAAGGAARTAPVNNVLRGGVNYHF